MDANNSDYPTKMGARNDILAPLFALVPAVLAGTFFAKLNAVG